jgi:hypothetical protein
MAEATSLSQHTISRILRGFGLRPHRTENFKLSYAPFFIDKVHDVEGLCRRRPEQAIVLCIDE